MPACFAEEVPLQKRYSAYSASPNEPIANKTVISLHLTTPPFFETTYSWESKVSSTSRATKFLNCLEKEHKVGSSSAPVTCLNPIGAKHPTHSLPNPLPKSTTVVFFRESVSAMPASIRSLTATLEKNIR